MPSRAPRGSNPSRELDGCAPRAVSERRRNVGSSKIPCRNAVPNDSDVGVSPMRSGFRIFLRARSSLFIRFANRISAIESVPIFARMNLQPYRQLLSGSRHQGGGCRAMNGRRFRCDDPSESDCIRLAILPGRTAKIRHRRVGTAEKRSFLTIHRIVAAA